MGDADPLLAVVVALARVAKAAGASLARGVYVHRIPGVGALVVGFCRIGLRVNSGLGYVHQTVCERTSVPGKVPGRRSLGKLRRAAAREKRQHENRQHKTG